LAGRDQLVDAIEGLRVDRGIAIEEGVNVLATTAMCCGSVVLTEMSNASRQARHGVTVVNAIVRVNAHGMISHRRGRFGFLFTTVRHRTVVSKGNIESLPLKS
jgi:hypothetical protein